MHSRRYRGLVMVVALPAALGCYTYAPLDTSASVQAGEHVSVEVTDRGRVELGDRLGLGVLRLEGTLTRYDSQELVMNVWRISQIGGETSRWSGESIRLRREYASRVQSRILNRGRTYVAAGAAMAGVVLLANSMGLLGSWSGGGTDTTVVPPPSSSRGWWP